MGLRVAGSGPGTAEGHRHLTVGGGCGGLTEDQRRCEAQQSLLNMRSLSQSRCFSMLRAAETLAWLRKR